MMRKSSTPGGRAPRWMLLAAVLAAVLPAAVVGMLDADDPHLSLEDDAPVVEAVAGCQECGAFVHALLELADVATKRERDADRAYRGHLSTDAQTEADNREDARLCKKMEREDFVEPCYDVVDMYGLENVDSFARNAPHFLCETMAVCRERGLYATLHINQFNDTGLLDFAGEAPADWLHAQAPDAYLDVDEANDLLLSSEVMANLLDGATTDISLTTDDDASVEVESHADADADDEDAQLEELSQYLNARGRQKYGRRRYGSAFKKIGGAVKKVGGAIKKGIKKVAPIAMQAASLHPAGAAIVGGIKAAKGVHGMLKQGNIKGAIDAGKSAIEQFKGASSPTGAGGAGGAAAMMFQQQATDQQVQGEEQLSNGLRKLHRAESRNRALRRDMRQLRKESFRSQPGHCDCCDACLPPVQ